MDNYVIIVAAGSGTRLGGALPKQFLVAAGRPVLLHTLTAFFNTSSRFNITIVLPAGGTETWQRICRQHRVTIPHRCTEGGPTRFASVKKALSLITGPGLVAIHDGVRPLADTTMIRRVFTAAAQYGTAVPVLPAAGSIRKVTKNGGSRSADRRQFVEVQTPQCFDVVLIKKAYTQRYRVAFTDDATVAEAAGNGIRLVEGDRRNIKITTTDDLAVAGALLRKTGKKQKPSQKYF